MSKDEPEIVELPASFGNIDKLERSIENDGKIDTNQVR